MFSRGKDDRSCNKARSDGRRYRCKRDFGEQSLSFAKRYVNFKHKTICSKRLIPIQMYDDYALEKINGEKVFQK